jgi:hypothetical protein
MTETITFSITEKDTGASIPAQELLRRYKVYCREVKSVDLDQKGGFALQGEMLHYAGNDSAHLTTQTSGKNPVVICVDKRDPKSSDKQAPVVGRWGMLFMPPMSISCGNIKFIAPMIYDEVAFNYLPPPSLPPIAHYTTQTREVIASGFESILAGQSVHANPYYTIAHDLAYLAGQKIIKFDAPPAHSIPNIDKSLKPKESLHGRFWLPGSRKFMGEIGGIVLAQPQLDPYGQPEFLAETLIAEFDNIPAGELEALLKLAQDQRERFRGMQAQFDMLEQLLDAKIKAGDAYCPNCGHEWELHQGEFGCLVCSCMNKRGGQAGNNIPF